MLHKFAIVALVAVSVVGREQLRQVAQFNAGSAQAVHAIPNYCTHIKPPADISRGEKAFGGLTAMQAGGQCRELGNWQPATMAFAAQATTAAVRRE